MIGRFQVGWYARRLASMSAAEIAHRIVEQGRKTADARKRWGWERFGHFHGPLHGLPGLTSSPTSTDLGAAACGRFQLLGQDWPQSPPGWEKTIWHLDPITRTNWPGADTFAFQVPYRHVRNRGDVKFVWEPNRLQFVQGLAAAGSFDRIPTILDGWMQANPPYNGINWTSGIELSSRIVSLLVAMAYADDALRTKLDKMARAFIEAHAFWISRYPSLYSSANNHRVAELAALFLTGICVPQMSGSGKYLRDGQKGLEREIHRQFLPDGVGAEQSPTYAAYSLEWFALAGSAADAMGCPFSPAYKNRVSAAVDHLRWLMDDGGRVPRIGDDDEGRVLFFEGSPDRYVSSVVERATKWLSGRPAASSGMCVFGDGGYTVIRESTAQGTLLAAFDHGPLGFLSIAAHGHADALSLWLHWGDEAIFVDAGTYLYHSGGEWRDRFRGTAAHNTLAIEGADQSVIAGAFNWSRHAKTRVVERTASSITAEHDGYRSRFGLVHRRRITHLLGKGIVIEDFLLGCPKRKGLRWLVGITLAPGTTAQLADIAYVETPRHRRLSVRLEGGADWRLTSSDYSPQFNCKSSAVRLTAGGEISPGLVAKITVSPCVKGNQTDFS